MFAIEVEQKNRKAAIRAFSKYLRHGEEELFMIAQIRTYEPIAFAAMIHYHNFYIQDTQWNFILGRCAYRTPSHGSQMVGIAANLFEAYQRLFRTR